MSQSKIFVRNRALGYVSNHIAHATRFILKRNENLIVTSVGRAFHTYSCSHFALLTVSSLHASDITCLAADTYHIFSTCENKIYAWRRGNELKHTYTGHDSPVHLLLPFGPHLISIDEESNIKVWDIKTEELMLELNFSNDIFKITTLAHPYTYVNKILLGSEQGQLQLWNIDTSKLIYTFKGWNSPVTALESAPAIDIAAIGLASGKIILHNLKVDRTVFELMQDWGLVTAITFRSDGQPIMATGTSIGHVVLWNLDERKMESEIMQAHLKAVTGLSCLPNEPMMVSSSPDNSLKLWIFDLADGGARLLKIREGHSEPPTCIRFYGNDGDNVLTAGGDSSLRIFSTITETFNKSLGKASYDRKASKKKGRIIVDPATMPPIMDIVSEKTREKDWCNIATSHLGIGMVSTWSYDNKKMGEHLLLPERFRKKQYVSATSLCITHCGNFIVIGYSSGHIDRFNMQSGIHRATYGKESGGHEGAVRGITVDVLNQTVVSAGRDKLLKFWPFKPAQSREPEATVQLDEPAEWLRNHKESSLVAIALQDFSIVLVDLENRRVVRHFRGHSGRLTDATFNPDARWLVTASMDCTIRTWDIPSAHLIDVFQVPEACTSVHFSPTGVYLATVHVCNLGIYLWSNRMLYSHVSLKALPADYVVPSMDLPGILVTDGEQLLELEEEAETTDEYSSPDQLHETLITLSLLPNSRWQNLLNIDIVKKRNKPREPLKVPETAPFFLPTIPALDIKFDLSNATNTTGSKLLKNTNLQTLTSFGNQLLSTTETNDFTNVFEMLKSFGPSSVDFEIQSLSLDEKHTTEVLLQFLAMIKWMMTTKRDFELSQAYLAAFLKTHDRTIVKTKKLVDYLEELSQVQLENWSILREKLHYNLSLVEHLRRM
ncbi:WD repeat-containing protein 36 [Orussus abietinus]|uniref:WD repeat-containing protein 36 n=1 Tax=Orussus abietinus TaxID=222816 RepID=UPI000626E5B9|nr:WD repeat-containing protein 36 [Orussus abietinus]